MVAMPIVVVTSWVLFQRLFRGEEKRTFPVKPVSKVKEGGEVGGGESGSRGGVGKGAVNRVGDVLHEDGQEIGEAVGKESVDGRGGT